MPSKRRCVTCRVTGHPKTAEDLFICVASRTGPEQLMLSVTSSMAEQVNMLRTLHTSMCVAHRVFR